MADSKNQLNKMIYEFTVANGMNLVNFDNPESIINTAWAGNPDVYSIVDKLSTMYVGMPKKPYRKKKDGTYEEITDPATVQLVNRANQSETRMQFEKMRYLYYLVTGNSFVWAPRFEGGNNKGQLLPQGMNNMPSQYVEIISGGWIQPIKEYIINYNYNTSQILPASQVIHVKMPNLRFTDGNNLYGMSPIKTAALIIESQNGGYKNMATTLKNGFPPGIISKEGEDDNEEEATNRANIFRKVWDRLSKKNKPIITSGKTTWTKIGFDNFKDLQIIENSQHGMRVLCNIYGVPSQLFNDTAGTTYANQKEARKAAYTNRLIPDANLFDEVDNINIWANYGFEVFSDYSNIPELQEDKKSLAEVIQIAQNSGAILSAEEIRTMLDMDVPVDEILKTRFVNVGKIPASQVGMEPDNVDQVLKQLGVNQYVK